MLKPFALLSAAVLFAVAPAPISGRIVQEAAPTQSQAPAQASAPVTGPVALDAVNPITPTPASLAQAKGIYERDCAMCHGDNGSGKTDLATSLQLTLDDWTNPGTLAGKHDGELFDAIRTGMDNGKMPSEPEGRATDTQVWNIIVYIRGLSKPKTAAAN